MDEVLEHVRNYWITWALGLISATLSARLYSMRKRQEEQRMRQIALEAGMQALLKDRITQAYEHYVLEKGYVTLHGLTSVNNMYESYTLLCQDESMRKLMNTIRSLEVRTE